MPNTIIKLVVSFPMHDTVYVAASPYRIILIAVRAFIEPSEIIFSHDILILLVLAFYRIISCDS